MTQTPSLTLNPLGPGASLPFDEQTDFDVRAGRRQAFRLGTLETSELGSANRAVGYAVVGLRVLDLEISAEFRARGFGGVAAGLLLDLPETHGALTAWSHGDHPAARHLAQRYGFTPTRLLLKMNAPLVSASTAPIPEIPSDSEIFDRIEITSFSPGVNEHEWLALNARAFFGHPEQGGLTLGDLRARMTEPWFDPGDFLLARLKTSGVMVGFCWVKIEVPVEASQGAQPEAASIGARVGEVYVLGVEPGQAGHGLGRILLDAALNRMRDRGCCEAVLYVDGDNDRARVLYERNGFQTSERHVQYTRD